MPELPLHPLTGIRALALTPRGRPIWPIAGADGDEDPPDKGGDSGAGDDPPDKGKGEGDGDGEPDFKAEAAKWKALARKHESQAKVNADAAKRLQAVEDADKTELQKLQEAQAADKRRADEAEARALRLEIAAEKGLSPSQAKRLVGATREELEADADELLEAFGGAKDGKDNGLKRPGTKPRSGNVPDAEPEENDPDKLAALIPRA